MNVFLYIAIFIAGAVFGSFFSLAVYRLPRKENITYVRSHCTSCNHRLNFLDLIPIFSYIFLGGKCRYCKEKIRNRYLLLEIFSGLVFLFIALSLKITSYSTLTEFINLFFIYLFICALFIIGGIDKEKYIIHEGTLLYGVIISLGYGLFNAYKGQPMTNNLIGFFIIPIILLVVNYFISLIRTEEKTPFGFGDIKYIALIGLFMGFAMQILTIILAVFIGIILMIIKKYKTIPFGYFLSIASVLIILFSTTFTPVIELINFNIL